MRDIIDEFLDYIRDEKHYSDLTYVNYNEDLDKFLQFLDTKKINNFKSIDYPLIREYLSYMHSLNYLPKTINRHISSLRSFFKYLLKHHHIKDNPLELVTNVKEAKRIPKFLFYNDLEKLFDVPTLDNPLGMRDALILEMFYATGVRVSELVNIKLKDINDSNQSIRILGKGSKERDVLYGARCGDLLNLYLSEGRKVLDKNNSVFLFLNHNGNKLTTRGVSLILDKILKKSGLNVKVTPHIIRHTFATHMLNEGADLLSVKQLLGHENLSTTQVYTHVSNERLRNVYLNSHPRAHKKGV
jgi:integrase/recombinase XerC